MIKSLRTRAEADGVLPGDVDRYVGKITGCCFEAEVSSQGKLLIPKPQRERLRLTDSATIVGRGSYFEIWAPADYEASHASDILGKIPLDQIFRILS